MGPSSNKRRLLASVFTSILRYGAAAWMPAIKMQRNITKLKRVQRLSAMRPASAYKTISFEAACVIAGVMPICIVIMEDAECYQSRKQSRGENLRTIRALHREESLRKWQQEWDDSTKGRWTHRLIPSIKEWMYRPER